jgi:EAL domain-containing protein (putative c-di-GMP-specific phosphodiesterase class I)
MEQSATSIEQAIRNATDPASLLQRIVEEATRLIPAAEGAALLLLDGDEFTWVCAGGLLSIPAGMRMPVAGSLAGLAIEQGRTVFSEDARHDRRANTRAVELSRTAATASVPLYYESRPIGCLTIGSPYPGAFSHERVEVLNTLAEFISTAIATVIKMNRITAQLLEIDDGPLRNGLRAEPASVAHFVANVLHPGTGSDMVRRQQIERVLEEGITTCFQPIVELSSRHLLGFEALARFPSGQTVDWFADAHRLGLGTALEEATCRRALSCIGLLPPECYLAVNLSPIALSRKGVPELFGQVDPNRIVLELTEHLRVEDYPSLRRRVSELRRQGFRLAIDDTGAGFASLSHIIRLEPDIIKLDLDLTRGIDLDPVRRSLATALMTFAADIDALVIAEGIETEGELATLLELGIGVGQGYLLGRPEPAAQLA